MGIITFDVYGRKSTPVDDPDGTTVEAKEGAEKVGEAKVTVSIPKTHTRQASPYTEIKYTNKATPLPVTMETELSTHSETTVVLTVLDQFGNTLDSIYDGTSVVKEIFSAPITGVWDERLNVGDRNTPIPIAEPDAEFKDGKKKDSFGLGRATRVTPVFTAGQRDGWSKFMVNAAGAGQPPANNAYQIRLRAIAVEPKESTVTQKIQVHGHDVKFKLGNNEHAGVLRKITVEDKLLTKPLGGPDTPIKLEDDPSN